MSVSSRPSWAAPFSAPELSYEQAERMAHDTGFFGSTGDPLLETVVDMLDELGRPDAAFDVIQIAGTNGKTSTSRYTAAILGGQGLSCALYTSPELVEMRERMEVDGRPVGYEAFAHGISLAAEAGRRVNARREQAGERPYRVTEFDLLTVAACVVFAQAGVDVAVLEVGLGGRWDATSATYPVATCVTGIGLDHCRILGDTLEQIAAEKAAVIKAGQACVLGVGTWAPSSVEDVFLSRCAEHGVEPVLLRPIDAADAPGEIEAGATHEHPELPAASYVITGRPAGLGEPLRLNVTTPLATYEGLRAVKPAYQAANIACAVTLAEAYLGRELEREPLRASVAACPTPGRFDALTLGGCASAQTGLFGKAEAGDETGAVGELSSACADSGLSPVPLHLIDAAHNPQSIRAFMASLAEQEPQVRNRPALLCAVLADKDVDGVVAFLAHEFPRVFVTATSSGRALPAAELAERFRAQGVEPAAVFATVPAACAALADAPYVAVGSITLAGEVAAYHRG